MVWVYAAKTPDGKLAPLILNHSASLGTLIYHRVHLMPNREWVLDTIGM